MFSAYVRGLFTIVATLIAVAFACALISSAFIGSVVYALGKRIDRVFEIIVPFPGMRPNIGERMINWVIRGESDVHAYDPSLPDANYDPFWWEDPPEDLYWHPDGLVRPYPPPDGDEGSRVPTRRRWFNFPIPSDIRAQGGMIYGRLDNMPWLVTSHFGVVRWDGWHNGTDFSMPVGTRIPSLHGGRAIVVATGFMPGGYGNYVVVSDGVHAVLYAHLSAIHVSVGSEVLPGQTIGLSGNTGRSTAPHLHLEVIRVPSDPNESGHYVNPCNFLACEDKYKN